MDLFWGRALSVWRDCVSHRNSEMDAYGVRGFGSVMSASKLAVATLALHAFAKTVTLFLFCPSGLPCCARSRPPASRFTSFRSAVVELTTTSLVLGLKLFNKTKKDTRRGCLFRFIGIARFELTTSCSRSKRSTRLSYIPVLWAQL